MAVTLVVGLIGLTFLSLCQKLDRSLGEERVALAIMWSVLSEKHLHHSILSCLPSLFLTLFIAVRYVDRHAWEVLVGSLHQAHSGPHANWRMQRVIVAGRPLARHAVT